VHGERLAILASDQQGSLGLLATALDQRFVVSACDFSQISSLASPLESDSYRLAELLATVAPRALRIQIPEDAAAASHWQLQAKQAAEVYQLRKAEEKLVLLKQAHSDDAQVFDWLASRSK
jgi:hypothetical protein